MPDKNRRPHAIALFSGGLDSSLSILLMLKQDIEVTALMFLNHFGCDIDDRSSCGQNPYPTAERFGFRVKLMHLGRKFIDLVKNPKYGYGKNMNPCTDCRIMMLGEAKQFMEMSGADFIITGEVLGQRPMSQQRNTLNLILKESDLGGYLLRPLSAKLMPPTIPEKQGLVDRDRLEAISGRSRRRQMELAEEFGLDDYASPAAGCLLTDRGYSTKLRDLLAHKEQVTFDDINLLRIGRHFRLTPEAKVVIGRNEKDNARLDKYAEKYPRLQAIDHGSPVTLLLGDYGPEQLRQAAALTARYSDGKKLEQIMVGVNVNGHSERLAVAPMSPPEVDRLRLVWEKRPIDGRYEWAGRAGRSSD
jgi:hypothetical protein